MKKALYPLIVGCVLIAALFVSVRIGLTSICQERMREADFYLRPYVEQLLPIVSTWDYDQIEPYMTDVFKTMIPEDEFRQELKELSQLGPMVSHKTPRLTKYKRFKHWLFGQKASDVFSVSAEFESGKAVLLFQIADTCGTGRLNFLTVNSPVLQRLSQQKKYEVKGDSK